MAYNFVPYAHEQRFVQIVIILFTMLPNILLSAQFLLNPEVSSCLGRVTVLTAFLDVLTLSLLCSN